MGKFPKQNPGYRLSVVAGTSASTPAQPETSTDFARFEKLAAKLVRTPKPEKG